MNYSNFTLNVDSFIDMLIYDMHTYLLCTKGGKK